MIQCDVCETSFHRQEHLTRHLRIHTSEKPFACPTCGKAFSRQDVLSRHIATHDQSNRELPRAYARACRECAASRVRCSRGEPCERCVSKGLQCDYPMARKRKAVSPEEASPEEDGHDSVSIPHGLGQGQFANTTTPAIGMDLTNDVSQVPGHPFDNIGLPAPTDRREFPSSSMGIANQPTWPSAARPSHQAPGLDVGTLENSGELDDPYGFPPSATYDGQVMGLSSINWMSPENQSMPDWASQLASLAYENAGNDFMGTQSLFGVQEQMRANTINSVGGSHSPALGLSSAAPSMNQYPDPVDGDERGSVAAEGTEDSTQSGATESRYYVEGAAARAPFRGRSTHGPSSIGLPAMADIVHEGGSSDSWISPRTDAGSTSDPNSNDLVSPRAYENLLRGLQVDAHQQSLGFDMNCFPSISLVRLFVRLYFEHFHPTLPFLRRGMDMYEKPGSWVLLLAVTTMGARYTSGGQNKILRDYLFGLSHQVLSRRSSTAEDDKGLWMPGFADLDDPPVDLPTLQARVLHLVSMLHAGTAFSVNQGLSERQNLVEACLSMDLLGQGGLARGADNPLPRDGLVRDWLDRQSRIRTGLTIWLLDSMIAFQFGCQPLMKLGDATAELPCKEDVWGHPTVDKVIKERSSSATLLEAIEILYMEKKLPPNLSQFSTQVLIYAIYRRTKEANYQHQTVLSSWTPSARIQQHSKTEVAEETWPPSRPILSKWRNSACDCLDILHWDANSIAATAAGWEHPTIMHLHLSRLLILTPTQHMQTFTKALSHRSLNGSSDNAKIVKARNHVLQWALRDQYKARLAIIHAGALLWHIRRYSSNSFLEPFSIYIATVVVWTYSISVQSVRRQTAPETQASRAQSPFGENTIAQTSPAGPATAQSPPATDEDPEPSFIHLDRPCDDEMVQTYVRLGDKMSAHMSRVGNIMESEAPRKILREGRRLIVGRDTPEPFSQKPGTEATRGKGPPVWGIERSYAELLERLRQATGGE